MRSFSPRPSRRGSSRRHRTCGGRQPDASRSRPPCPARRPLFPARSRVGRSAWQTRRRRRIAAAWSREREAIGQVLRRVVHRVVDWVVHCGAASVASSRQISAGAAQHQHGIRPAKRKTSWTASPAPQRRRAPGCNVVQVALGIRLLQVHRRRATACWMASNDSTHSSAPGRAEQMPVHSPWSR